MMLYFPIDNSVHNRDGYVGAVYKIINKINGRFYIGSSFNLKIRLYLHFFNLNKRIHKNKLMQDDFNEYGAESFNIKILDIFHSKLPPPSNYTEKCLMLKRESDLIFEFQPEYNINSKTRHNIAEMERDINEK